MRIILFLLMASCAFGQASEPICSAHPWAKLYPVKGFCGLCYQDSINAAKFADIEKRLKALEDRQGAVGTIRIDTLSAPSWKTVPRDFDSLITNPKWELRIVPLGSDTIAIHGRFYPILSKVRSDSVVERKHGRFYEDLKDGYPDKQKCQQHSWYMGNYDMSKDKAVMLWFSPDEVFKCKDCGLVVKSGGYPFCPPHSWAWGDTTVNQGAVSLENPRCKIYISTAHHNTLFIREDAKIECPGICRNCLTDTLAVLSYAEDQQRKQADKNPTEYEMLKARKK